MNPLLRRFGKKTFCSLNHYHHDYVPGKQPKNFLELSLGLFDFGRAMLYLFLITKVILTAPSFILFRKTKFSNNPDYALCDEATFTKLNH